MKHPQNKSKGNTTITEDKPTDEPKTDIPNTINGHLSLLDRIIALEQEEKLAMSNAKSHSEMSEVVASYVAKFDEVQLDVQREAIFNAVQFAKADLEKVHITLSGKWTIDVDDDDYSVGVAKSVGKSSKATSTRSVDIKRGDDDIGSFANAKLACETLTLDVGKDSAVRVLQRAGYTVILKA